MNEIYNNGFIQATFFGCDPEIIPDDSKPLTTVGRFEETIKGFEDLLSFTFSLQQLDLSNQGLVDTSIITLGPALAGLASLLSLDLSKNDIVDNSDSCKVLCKAISCAHMLETIDLACTRCGA